jgi:hypothetical protein
MGLVAGLILATTTATTVWWHVRWLPAGLAGQDDGLLPIAVADILALATVVVGVGALLVQRRAPSLRPLTLTASGALVVLGAAGSAHSATHATLAWTLTAHVAALWLLYLIVASRMLAVSRIAYGLLAGLLVQLPLAFEQVARQTTSPANVLFAWPGNYYPNVPNASVLLMQDGTRWLRAYGPFFHPNMLGGYLAIELVLLMTVVVLWRRHPSPLWCCAFGVAIGLVCGALALSASRSAWLGAFVGVLTLAAGYWRGASIERSTAPRPPVSDASPGRVAMGAIATLTSIAATFALVMLVFRPPLFARFHPTANTLEQQSVQERLFLDRLGLRMVAAHPLLGVGAGNADQAEFDVFHGAYSPAPIHNAPLLMAVELGPAAILAWVVGGAGVLWQTWRRPGVWPVAFAATLVVVAVVGAFDYYFWSFSVAATTVTILAGAWTAAWRSQKTGCNLPGMT